MADTQANAPDVITLRGRIIGMWECGKSSRDIAHMTGVSVRTVNRWINRWREEGSVKTKPRSGRPKVTSRDDVARILDTIHERPKTNTVQLHHTRTMYSCIYTTFNASPMTTLSLTLLIRDLLILYPNRPRLSSWDHQFLTCLPFHSGSTNPVSFQFPPSPRISVPPSRSPRPPSIRANRT
ncbi:hypothetical protein Pcinc_010879 [Petrolisthes cinctipes]|uniref:Transposase n=1 Tax=Petrolisthes cinctipes TaxID=88211 RepID=A0AAE1KX01_PETCI|nr:hypothetical protein Pcinc_010879 [Petrolisthes cinctipes]